MRKRVIFFFALLLGAAVGVVMAQESAPTAERVASVSVGNGGALTYVSGGDYLVVADGDQLQLYNVKSPDSPQDAASVVLDDTPLALAATSNFALAVVPSRGDVDTLVIIAPDRYSRGGFGAVNYLDVPKNARLIVLSPNDRWALVSGDAGYVTMGMSAADNIESSSLFETGDSPVIAAALTDDVALLIRRGDPVVQSFNLSTSSASEMHDELRLDAPATAISVSGDSTLGAAALEDNRLTLFDAQTMAVYGTFDLEDGPVSQMRFIQSGRRSYLALMIEGRTAVMVLDVTEPTKVSLPGSVSMRSGARIRSIAAHDGFLALSGGNGVDIFRFPES
jgi:hypothetical protein